MPLGECCQPSTSILSSPTEVAIIGSFSAPEMFQMLRRVWDLYLPNKVVAAAPDGDEQAAALVPLLADRPSVDNMVTAYICRNYICERPTTDRLKSQDYCLPSSRHIRIAFSMPE